MGAAAPFLKIYLWEKQNFKVISDWWSYTLLLLLGVFCGYFVCFSGGNAPLLKYSLWRTFYCCGCLQEQIEQSQMKQSHIFHRISACDKMLKAWNGNLFSIYTLEKIYIPMVTELPLLNYKLQRTGKIFSVYTHK